jgi:hypothetical protein
MAEGSGAHMDSEALAALHPSANDPNEPYQGVAALFNGDLHAVDPAWAPRSDWQVLSPYFIELVRQAGEQDADQAN